MASIRKRARKDGSVSYTVQIRIKRDGKIVYQESKTFHADKYDNPHRSARGWAAAREAELNRTEPWRALVSTGLTVAEAMLRFIDEAEASPRGIGKTKRSCMGLMAREPLLANVPLTQCDSALFMTYLRKRALEDGAAPATVAQDVIYFRVLLDYARVSWGLSVDPKWVDDVQRKAEDMEIVGRADARERRPTLDELDLILRRCNVDRTGRVRKGTEPIPTARVILFLIFSTRRISEVVRITWSDLDHENRRVLVRNMKHPRKKKGNDRWVHLPERAWAILMQQPRIEGEPCIFPYKASSVGTNFRRACRDKDVEVEDLRLHDLRHEGISHYFEMGWDIPRVAMVSGHASWDNLRRYTHLSQTDPVDKYDGWKWLELV